MQFGIYLVDNGVLTPDEFVEAVKLFNNGRPQLGAVAVQRRLLSCRQVFSILRSQCDHPDQLFGDVAIKLGFLSPEDVGALILEQSRQSVSFRDILTEHRFLAPEVVEKHYHDYRECLAQTPQQSLAGA